MKQELTISKNNFIETSDEYLKKLKEGKIGLARIPKKIRTYEMCLEAIKKNYFFTIKYVPKKYLTEELYLTAIKSDETAMRLIPDNIKNKKFCLKALRLNEKCFIYLPSKYIDYKMAMKFVPKNGEYLKYVDKDKKTKELCLKAFENNPSCIRYIPKKFIKKDMYITALNQDCNVFDIIPEKLISKELCISVLEKAIEFKEDDKYINLFSIGEIISKQYENDKDIISLERKCGIRYFTQKRYDKDTNKFYTTEEFKYKKDIENKEFDEFDKFNEYIDFNLSEADLFDFDFDGIDVKKIDYSNAFINSSVLIKNDLYDNSAYEKLISNNKNYLSIPYANEEDEDIPDSNYEVNNYVPNIYSSFDIEINNIQKIYYISDLHLSHKLEKRFPEHASYIEIVYFITQIVDKMTCNVNIHNCLLIGGDTSSSFEVTKIFFKILRQKWKGKIITILGNHEIWNQDNEISNAGLDGIIKEYRDYLNELKIIVLQNQLLFDHDDGIKILSEEEILNSSDDYLRELSSRSKLIILGGLGYSGYNKKYNADFGLYQNTIKNLEEDITETNKFNKIYKHVRKIFSDTKMIVFTHTQKNNWNTDDYVKKWVYVNGHTHKNIFYKDDDKTVYSDNQIGYYRTNIRLKFFEISTISDYFKYYKNGIYEISRDDYITFYRGINTNINFNKIDGKLIMLKNNEIYLFLYQNSNDNLYLLDGGSTRILKNQNINYYYENMDILSYEIKKATMNYNNTLNSLNNNSDSTIEFFPDTSIYSVSNKMLKIQYLTELNVIRFWNDEIIDKLKASKNKSLEESR